MKNIRDDQFIFKPVNGGELTKEMKEHNRKVKSILRTKRKKLIKGIIKKLKVLMNFLCGFYVYGVLGNIECDIYNKTQIIVMIVILAGAVIQTRLNDRKQKKTM